MVGVGACVCVCASSSYCCIVVFVGAMPLLYLWLPVSLLCFGFVSVLYFGLWDICGYFALFGFVSILYFGLRDICGYLCLYFVSGLCL